MLSSNQIHWFFKFHYFKNSFTVWDVFMKLGIFTSLEQNWDVSHKIHVWPQKDFIRPFFSIIFHFFYYFLLLFILFHFFIYLLVWVSLFLFHIRGSPVKFTFFFFRYRLIYSYVEFSFKVKLGSIPNLLLFVFDIRYQ